MLTAGYADEPRLPQADLVYVAFRVCYFDLLTELETEATVGTSDFDEGPYGWPSLPEHMKAAILTLVESAS